MIDSKCNRYALELVHNRKVNITNQQTKTFSYIYQQIINISQNAPVYLIYPTDEIQQFATQIKDLSIQLSDYLKTFYTDNDENPFRQLKLAPLPSEFITVKLLKQPDEQVEYNIHIDSVANGQQNIGTYVSKGVCPFTERTYTFTIQTDEQSYDFEIKVTNSSSNESILKKIASLINRATEQLEATLLYDHSKLALSIKASAHRQNTPATFTIKDSVQDGLVSYYHLNQIAASPGHSEFRVNDEAVESYGVAFVIDETFEITLHAPCEQTIKISFEQDRGIIENSILNLQRIINHLLSLSYTSKKHTLEKEILDILLSHKEALSQVGIYFDDSLMLATNQEQLESSIQNHSLEELFSDDESFAPELLEHTQTIILDPMKYVPNKIVSYKDYSKINYPNPYMTSMYSGFIFTSYC